MGLHLLSRITGFAPEQPHRTGLHGIYQPLWLQWKIGRNRAYQLVQLRVSLPWPDSQGVGHPTYPLLHRLYHALLPGVITGKPKVNITLVIQYDSYRAASICG
jgi:hypothetical protein